MDVQQSNSSSHAPYFEMMSDKCKSPTAALTCPDTSPNTVLPAVPSSEMADTSSPAPETSAVPKDQSEDRNEDQMETETSKTSTTAYSIAEILNAGSAQRQKSEENTEWNALPHPPAEQQLKSNIPESHPLKEAVKSDATNTDDQHSLLRQNLIDATSASAASTTTSHVTNGGMVGESGKKDLRLPSAEEYNEWLKQHANTSRKGSDDDVLLPEAKRQKTQPSTPTSQISPSVASSYIQGQAAANLWYQNIAAGAGAYPYPTGGFTVDPVMSAQLALYPNYLLAQQPSTPVLISPSASKVAPSTPKSPKPQTPSAIQADIQPSRPISAASKLQKDHEMLFQCQKCPRNFDNGAKLLRHELTHPYARPFNCGLSLKPKLKEEIVPAKVVETSVSCLLCAEKYPNQAELQKHVAQVHRKQSAASSPVMKEEVTNQYFRCSFCSQFLPSRMELIEHEKVHLSARPIVPAPAPPQEPIASFQCRSCPERFTEHSTCQEHEKLHVHVAPPCVSQAAFPEAKMLQECLTGKEMEKTEVPSSANNNNNLENGGSMEYACPICQKQFISSKLLKSHVKYSHLEERPYTCSICSKSFKQKATLKQHEKLHSDEKPYVCSICSRGFVYPSRLKTHSQTCKGDAVMSP